VARDAGAALAAERDAEHRARHQRRDADDGARNKRRDQVIELLLGSWPRVVSARLTRTVPHGLEPGQHAMPPHPGSPPAHQPNLPELSHPAGY
jgi:hypothetical protein